jgi:hypothetical protein
MENYQFPGPNRLLTPKSFKSHSPRTPRKGDSSKFNPFGRISNHGSYREITKPIKKQYSYGITPANTKLNRFGQGLENTKNT